MRVVTFFLLLFCSTSILAKGLDLSPDMIVTPLRVSQYFDEQNSISADIPDLVDREDKVSACVQDYVEKQSKSYAKIAQNNLYDLIRNFDRITSEVYGKKSKIDEIPYEEKIEALANIQCEVYYKMGVLK